MLSSTASSKNVHTCCTISQEPACRISSAQSGLRESQHCLPPLGCASLCDLQVSNDQRVQQHDEVSGCKRVERQRTAAYVRFHIEHQQRVVQACTQQQPPSPALSLPARKASRSVSKQALPQPSPRSCTCRAQADRQWGHG